MEIWFFMMICDLLIPLTMIGFGSYFKKNPPKEISGAFGYRTAMSMKNKDTWDFAHHYCGELWIKLGWMLLVLSVITMLFVFKRNESIVGNVGGVLCSIQVIILIISIIPTEIALKKNFDEHGHKKYLNQYNDK